MEPLEFLLGREYVEAFVGRLEADIDDVGPFTDQFLVDVPSRLAGVVVDTRIVRRLFADVQHTHDPGRILVTDPQSGGVDAVHIPSVEAMPKGIVVPANGARLRRLDREAETDTVESAKPAAGGLLVV